MNQFLSFHSMFVYHQISNAPLSLYQFYSYDVGDVPSKTSAFQPDFSSATAGRTVWMDLDQATLNVVTDQTWPIMPWHHTSFSVLLDSVYASWYISISIQLERVLPTNEAPQIPTAFQCELQSPRQTQWSRLVCTKVRLPIVVSNLWPSSKYCEASQNCRIEKGKNICDGNLRMETFGWEPSDGNLRVDGHS